MYGPHVAILLICVSRNTRRVYFRGLTGSQQDPRFWGITHVSVQYCTVPSGTYCVASLSFIVIGLYKQTFI